MMFAIAENGQGRFVILVEDLADQRVGRIWDVQGRQMSYPNFVDSILAHSGPFTRIEPPREVTELELAGVTRVPSPRGWDERMELALAEWR